MSKERMAVKPPRMFLNNNISLRFEFNYFQKVLDNFNVLSESVQICQFES